MDNQEKSIHLAPARDDSPEAQDASNEDVLESVDALVRAKRMQKRGDEGGDITNQERVELIDMYCKLEEIREKRKGRFLMEYDNGLETVVQEFRKFAV
ncbi:MAG: hypothetical protein AAF716_04430 [Cyanobacteria bacterium P01_D01_bin.1]